jgi:hypothetical protein
LTLTRYRSPAWSTTLSFVGDEALPLAAIWLPSASKMNDFSEATPGQVSLN